MMQMSYLGAEAPARWTVTTSTCTPDLQSTCKQWGPEYRCVGCYPQHGNEIKALQTLLNDVAARARANLTYPVAVDAQIGFRTCAAIGLLAGTAGNVVPIPEDLAPLIVACQAEYQLPKTIRDVASWVPTLYAYFSQVAAALRTSDVPSVPSQPLPGPLPTPGLPKPSLAKAALPWLAVGAIVATSISMALLGSQKRRRNL